MSVPNTTPPRLKLRWYQFSLRALLVFTTLGAVVLSAGQMLGWRLLIFLVVCLIQLLVFMAAGARAGGGRKLRWAFACCESLATVYGPLLVVAANTWLSDGQNTWLRADMWKLFLVAPGNIELVAVTIWHRQFDISPTMEMMISGLVSVLILAISAWLAAKTRRAKWVVLPLVNVLCAYGALFLDAGMRM